VFELLETLYQAFDAIAVRRKVFKVETIGDCYVAVASLPEPQENHAVIMVKFADDCMTKLGQLTTELADSLGPDTATLAMRVGLHSGSVTGGVLRGQKSRFQLFGDTMNTASRMESNGAPHKIHVSQETADELTAKGKASWISPREDKIVAKGKGELQTYQ
jgi:class 3 adenylate cyclase